MSPHRVASLRRALRAGQLGCIAWLGMEVLLAVFASPAAADNCSVFTDCFRQANSAAEAAFGLTLLAGFSLLLDMIPVVGEVKGVIEAGTGRDLLTGKKLAPWERALGLIPFVPFTDLLGDARQLDDVGDMLRHEEDLGDLLRHGDEISDVVRHEEELGGLLRHGDELGDVGRGLDDVDELAPTHANRFEVEPQHRHLIDEYRDPDTTPVRRREISEQLGEAGGERYLQEVTGKPALTTMRPTTDGDVAGYADMVSDGEAWPHAVTFGGSRATNIVYFDGETMHVIEAKGGSSAYGDRLSGYVDPGNRIPQTDPKYPRDVAANMADSPLRDGRNEIGDAIERAYEADQVRYVGVRTGGRDELLAGEPTTVVEHVFLEPGG